MANNRDPEPRPEDVISTILAVFGILLSIGGLYLASLSSPAVEQIFGVISEVSFRIFDLFVSQIRILFRSSATDSPRGLVLNAALSVAFLAGLINWYSVSSPSESVLQLLVIPGVNQWTRIIGELRGIRIIGNIVGIIGFVVRFYSAIAVYLGFFIYSIGLIYTGDGSEGVSVQASITAILAGVTIGSVYARLDRKVSLSLKSAPERAQEAIAQLDSRILVNQLWLLILPLGIVVGYSSAAYNMNLADGGIRELVSGLTGFFVGFGYTFIFAYLIAFSSIFLYHFGVLVLDLSQGEMSFGHLIERYSESTEPDKNDNSQRGYPPEVAESLRET